MPHAVFLMEMEQIAIQPDLISVFSPITGTPEWKAARRWMNKPLRQPMPRFMDVSYKQEPNRVWPTLVQTAPPGQTSIQTVSLEAPCQATSAERFASVFLPQKP